jgi:hypothetical protein
MNLLLSSLRSFIGRGDTLLRLGFDFCGWFPAFPVLMLFRRVVFTVRRFAPTPSLRSVAAGDSLLFDSSRE